MMMMRRMHVAAAAAALVCFGGVVLAQRRDPPKPPPPCPGAKMDKCQMKLDDCRYGMHPKGCVLCVCPEEGTTTTTATTDVTNTRSSCLEVNLDSCLNGGRNCGYDLDLNGCLLCVCSEEESTATAITGSCPKVNRFLCNLKGCHVRTKTDGCTVCDCTKKSTATAIPGPCPELTRFLCYLKGCNVRTKTDGRRPTRLHRIESKPRAITPVTLPPPQVVTVGPPNLFHFWRERYFDGDYRDSPDRKARPRPVTARTLELN